MKVLGTMLLSILCLVAWLGAAVQAQQRSPAPPGQTSQDEISALQRQVMQLYQQGQYDPVVRVAARILAICEHNTSRSRRGCREARDPLTLRSPPRRNPFTRGCYSGDIKQHRGTKSLSIPATYPLYVTTSWPGPNGLHESRSVVQPGGTLSQAGESTISIPRAFDSADLSDPVRWEASLTRDGSTTATSLAAQPDASIVPGQFDGHNGSVTTKQLIAAQSFTLPWSPGGSHLTLVAKDAAGKILATENFEVRGTMASVRPPAGGASSTS